VPDEPEVSEREFASLLDTLAPVAPVAPVAPAAAPAAAPAVSPAVPPATAAPAAAAGDEITDAEFESLLDQLHGRGRHGGVPGAAVQNAPPVPQAAPPARPAAPADAAAGPPVAGEPEAPGKGAEKSADKGAETTVRVDTGVLDHIMNMVGELVLARNRLVALGALNADEQLAKAVGNLDVVTTDLQSGVMRTRMQPIRKVFGRFPRVVRDLARSLRKEVNLEMQGEDTDLDKNLVEALADPLVHLVRNAVDHGIELPQVRESHGKPRAGQLLLAAEQAGDHILLRISDDGAGMDPEVLRRKAVEKGVMDAEAAQRLDARDCYNLIFLPGFSTKAQISDVSGRGVGMDVVKTRIAQLNGIVDIDSALGKGTTIQIKVPLTLAIVPTLMVVLGSQIFALPLVNVSEIFDLKQGMTNVVDGQLVVKVRDRPLPLFYLSQWLVRAGGRAGSHVVVVHVGTQRVGFVVEQLLGQEEVVIKPLGALLHRVPGMAGATITGDGRIALILDVPSLIRGYAQRR
jgi:two-component system chemotaxis sensor kinase CheA